MSKHAFFWFRRDLRWDDNAGLYFALRENSAVRLVFIFDDTILKPLKGVRDLRVLFIHQTLAGLQKKIAAKGGVLEVYHGEPEKIWKKLLAGSRGSLVYANHDYEPDAQARDQKVAELCEKAGGEFKTFKDHVIFEKDEILNGSGKPYTVFTPYKKKWLELLNPFYLKSYPVEKYASHLAVSSSRSSGSGSSSALPSLAELGFPEMSFEFPSTQIAKEMLKNYETERDFPAQDATSRIGVHLRFGTVSIREVVRIAKKTSSVWLSELIWREFFTQILFHFPHVATSSFRPVYDTVPWRTSKKDFEKWATGQTGYPLVDAGMRELNATGFMHNRVRMVAASFLTKHLLIHWSEGERYFASKLLDYDMSANNGNWQWAAGSGCDAAPYFRVFNPEAQRVKFDKSFEYIRKWVPEYGTPEYPQPMVEHAFARGRALSAYHSVLKSGQAPVQKPAPKAMQKSLPKKKMPKKMQKELLKKDPS